MEGDIPVRRVAGNEKPSTASPTVGSEARQGLKKSLSRLNNLTSITSTGDLHAEGNTTRRKVEKLESDNPMGHAHQKEKDVRPSLVVRYLIVPCCGLMWLTPRSSLNDLECEGGALEAEKMSLQVRRFRMLVS
jgi:hypothetical protein